jgi:FK506-binding nuclear protein
MGMRVGGERIVEIPPGMGYGKKNIGGIPGGSTLVFSIQLVDVEGRG